MGYVNGVNLLPSTGEFTYATTAHQGQRMTELALVPVNLYEAGVPPKTDYPINGSWLVCIWRESPHYQEHDARTF
jgi:hypothetical protein